MMFDHLPRHQPRGVNLAGASQRERAQAGAADAAAQLRRHPEWRIELRLNVDAAAVDGLIYTERARCTKASHFALRMDAGTFGVAADPILITSSGKLINGKARVTAIAVYGVTLRHGVFVYADVHPRSMIMGAVRRLIAEHRADFEAATSDVDLRPAVLARLDAIAAGEAEF